MALKDVQILVVCLDALTLGAFEDGSNFDAVEDEKVSVSQRLG